MVWILVATITPVVQFRVLRGINKQAYASAKLAWSTQTLHTGGPHAHLYYFSPAWSSYAREWCTKKEGRLFLLTQNKNAQTSYINIFVVEKVIYRHRSKTLVGYFYWLEVFMVWQNTRTSLKTFSSFTLPVTGNVGKQVAGSKKFATFYEFREETLVKWHGDLSALFLAVNEQHAGVQTSHTHLHLHLSIIATTFF